MVSKITIIDKDTLEMFIMTFSNDCTIPQNLSRFLRKINKLGNSQENLKIEIEIIEK